MKISMIGVGRLGLPVALVVENKGHEVVGVDPNPQVVEFLKDRKTPYMEEGVEDLIKKTNLKMVSLSEAVAHAEIALVAIQTPAYSGYDGENRLPKEKSDYNYSFIIKGIGDIAKEALKQQKHVIVVLMSTVLPGTTEKYIQPLLNEYVHLAYQPFFTGMGTAKTNLEKAEFVLLGCDDHKALTKIKKFWKSITDAPIVVTEIKNAELIKVLYNVYLSAKVSFITSAQELCHKVGADVDEITRALSLATTRLHSPMYLRGGNGDGGPCHPKDLTALCWIAEQNSLSFNWFESIMKQREAYMDWLADLIEEEKGDLPVIICGIAFKKNINLTVGSPNLLLMEILKERGIEAHVYDPLIYPENKLPSEPGLFFIGMDHDQIKELQFPKGSVVIDVWGIIPDQEEVEVVRVGRI